MPKHEIVVPDDHLPAWIYLHDQNQSGERGAMDQIRSEKPLPLGADLGRRLGKTVAGQVDQILAIDESEVVKMLRPPRHLGNERESRMVGQRVDGRRFTGIRATSEGNFADGIGRQIV